MNRLPTETFAVLARSGPASRDSDFVVSSFSLEDVKRLCVVIHVGTSAGANTFSVNLRVGFTTVATLATVDFAANSVYLMNYDVDALKGLYADVGTCSLNIVSEDGSAAKVLSVSVLGFDPRFQPANNLNASTVSVLS